MTVQCNNILSWNDVDLHCFGKSQHACKSVLFYILIFLGYRYVAKITEFILIRIYIYIPERFLQKQNRTYNCLSSSSSSSPSSSSFSSSSLWIYRGNIIIASSHRKCYYRLFSVKAFEIGMCYEPITGTNISFVKLLTLQNVTLRKHAYSNIFKILQPKKENF